MAAVGEILGRLLGGGPNDLKYFSSVIFITISKNRRTWHAG